MRMFREPWFTVTPNSANLSVVWHEITGNGSYRAALLNNAIPKVFSALCMVFQSKSDDFLNGRLRTWEYMSVEIVNRITILDVRI